MLDKKELFNNYLKIDENFVNPMIESKDPYKEIDAICSKLNRKKFMLLEKSCFAKMGGVVESTEERPIIGTQALDTCYGILFYDRKMKKGLVGHGSPSGKLGTLNYMINQINDGSPKVIEYMIVPGFRNVDYGDMEGLDELQCELVKKKPANIVFIPLKTLPEILLHEPTLSYEFAFDTRTGQFVSNIVFFDETEINPRFISKSQNRFRK